MRLAGELAAIERDGERIICGGGASLAAIVKRATELGALGDRVRVRDPGHGRRRGAHERGRVRRRDARRARRGAGDRRGDGERSGGPDELGDALPAVERGAPARWWPQAVLGCGPATATAIRATVRDMQRRRREAQPAKVRTFGSVWKNPAGEPDGRAAAGGVRPQGLRRRRRPHLARARELHRELDGARSADVIALMREARRRARERGRGAGARGADARADRARRLDARYDGRRSADRLAGLGGRAPCGRRRAPRPARACRRRALPRAPDHGGVAQRVLRHADAVCGARRASPADGQDRHGRCRSPRHGICCQCRPGAAPAPAGTQEGGGEAQARAALSGVVVVLAPGGYWLLANSSAFAVSGVSVSGGGAILSAEVRAGGGRRRRRAEPAPGRRGCDRAGGRAAAVRARRRRSTGRSRTRSRSRSPRTAARRRSLGASRHTSSRATGACCDTDVPPRAGCR